MSNPVREQIGTILSGDATLAGIATGGVHLIMVTDDEVSDPFCIFHLDTGSEEWAMGGSGIEHDTWIVKGASADAIAAEDIDLRARELLDGATLGAGNLFCRRLGPIQYGDVAEGDGMFYAGSRYRVSTDD
jgi:hypothetical protein